MHLEVLAAEVALSSEEHLNVLLGGVEDGGEVGRGHFDGGGLALYELVEGLEKVVVMRARELSNQGTFGGGNFASKVGGASARKRIAAKRAAGGRRNQSPEGSPLGYPQKIQGVCGWCQ